MAKGEEGEGEGRDKIDIAAPVRTWEWPAGSARSGSLMMMCRAARRWFYANPTARKPSLKACLSRSLHLVRDIFPDFDVFSRSTIFERFSGKIGAPRRDFFRMGKDCNEKTDLVMVRVQVQ